MTEYEMECKLVSEILAEKGLSFNPELCTVEDIIEYLNFAPSDYSIFEWIKDTKMNYPELFLKEDE